MARRATFLSKARTDTVPTLFVDAGNFATVANDEEATPRRDLLTSFYRDQAYDAVALGEAELSNPIETWQKAQENGVPILAANLFKGKRSKKPLFEPSLWVERGGLRMAVVGLVPERALLRSPDSLSLRVASPFEQEKLMRKIAKRSDYIAIIGDFTPQEGEALAIAYPYVDVIVSSSPAAIRTMNFGSVTMVACGGKGYYGDYVQMPVERTDSVGVSTVRETLDTKIPADTTYEAQIARSHIKPRK